MVESFEKWFGNSNVERFEESNGHNNSILVSEWIGALCYVPLVIASNYGHCHMCKFIWTLTTIQKLDEYCKDCLIKVTQ